MKHTFTIKGMSCAACVARVEKAVSKVDGVDTVSVNLLTNSMVVEGTADTKAIAKAVVDAGYGIAARRDSDTGVTLESDTPSLVKRLVSSSLILIPLMTIAMSHMDPSPMLGTIEMLLSLAIVLINRKFFISGTKGALHGSPNMDTLVALGASAAWLFSLVSLYITHDYSSLYFESAGTILTLITLGKTLESYSKGKTTSAIKGLLKLTPETATVIRQGREVLVGIAEVEAGDVFVVKPGESVPVDGTVLEGGSSIDESALTGESIPVDKLEGDEVIAGTINRTGWLKCKATRTGPDTTISKIIKLVSEASSGKAPIARIADKVSGVFVPIVLILAAITTLLWAVTGTEFSQALLRGVAVLVVSCPCALGLATPVAIMTGSGRAARAGILFKKAEALEMLGKVRTVVLDKTGTVTSGKAGVSGVFPAEGVSEDDLLKVALAVEAPSSHPLASAVTEHCRERGVEELGVTGFETILGNGVEALLGGECVKAGNAAFIGLEQLPEEALQCMAEGQTPLFFRRADSFLGMISVADTIKEDSAKAIGRLHSMGVRTVMLTGDNARTANAIAVKAGIGEVHAELLPEQKAEMVWKLQSKGPVAMIGDGINDALALSVADVGIAIGAGTDIAIDAADVVLSRSGLDDAATAIALSRKTLLNIKENLFWAFFYNVVMIPLAAGVFFPLTGWSLNPMIAAAAMSMSSFCVVTNALRLNIVKLK